MPWFSLQRSTVWEEIQKTLNICGGKSWRSPPAHVGHWLNLIQIIQNLVCGPPKNDPTSVSSLVKLSKPTQTPEWDSTPKSDPPNKAYSTIHYLETFGGRISWQKFHLRTSYCAWQLLGTARFPILWCHRKYDFTWKNGDMGVWKVWWHALLAVILMEKIMINHPIWGCPIFLSKPDEKLLRRYETKVVPSLGF